LAAQLYLYQDEESHAPLLRWLDGLPKKARAKCLARIARLVQLGNELRRPEADYLRDGIYELRAGYQGIHYRILYFFSGKAIVVLSHGLTKEQAVPKGEIDKALERKKHVEADFTRYTLKPEFQRW
jgi:phage-related protein